MTLNELGAVIADAVFLGGPWGPRGVAETVVNALREAIKTDHDMTALVVPPTADRTPAIAVFTAILDTIK